MLRAGQEMLGTLRRHDARAFVVWTRHPDLLTLRNPHATSLSPPYRQLLYLLRSHMRSRPAAIGSLNFDQRADDASTACAVSNFLARTHGWRRFMIAPNFTVSSVSPGLQAADLIAYLGPHYAEPSSRPELAPFLTSVLDLGGVVREARGAQVVAVATE